jgi:hypothetical protein
MKEYKEYAAVIAIFLTLAVACFAAWEVHGMAKQRPVIIHEAIFVVDTMEDAEAAAIIIRDILTSNRR